MQRLKGIIFDFDGTLADTLPLCILSFQEAMYKVTGIRYSESDITQHFGKSEEGIISILAPHCYENALDTYIETYEKNHHLCPDVFDGIREILDELAANNVNTALITGKGRHTIDVALDYMGLKKYFEYVEHGDPNGSVKTKCIRTISGLWGLHPSGLAYVGDQPSDIKESKAAGVLSVAVSWAQTSNHTALLRHKPDMIFSEVSEFREWVQLSTICFK